MFLQLILGSLPQRERSQTSLSIAGDEAHHNFGSTSRRPTVSDDDGGGERREVGAGAATAETAAGLDGDVGRSYAGEGFEGLKRALPPASPVDAHPEFELRPKRTSFWRTACGIGEMAVG